VGWRLFVLYRRECLLSLPESLLQCLADNLRPPGILEGGLLFDLLDHFRR
jgi:hypothetical protein